MTIQSTLSNTAVIGGGATAVAGTVGAVATAYPHVRGDDQRSFRAIRDNHAYIRDNVLTRDVVALFGARESGNPRAAMTNAALQEQFPSEWNAFVKDARMLADAEIDLQRAESLTKFRVHTTARTTAIAGVALLLAGAAGSYAANR